MLTLPPGYTMSSDTDGFWFVDPTGYDGFVYPTIEQTIKKAWDHYSKSNSKHPREVF